MEDEKIIGLYWERNEDAITETSSKYGKLFFRIASNILLNHEDSEECVNDTYLGLWNAIPKERPSPFSVFASRITRNLALKKYEYLSAEKRKPEAICSFEELGDCVSGKEYVESEAENRRIEQLIDTFLCQIGEEKRNIFYADTGILIRLRRFDSILDFINDKRIDVAFTEARIVFADGESETRSITGNTPYVFAFDGVRAVKDVEFISGDLTIKYSDFFSEDLMEASETLDTADLFN